MVDDQQATLFTVVGIAAFLGAGYRTPLAGVMFVAESTGRPGFVVPGLLASVVSQLFMGPASVSAYQRTGRVGHLERRVGLPPTTAIQADVLTVPPDVTLDEFHRDHLLLARRRFVAVVDDDGRYVGMAGLHDLQQVPIEQWGEVTVADIVEKDLPTAPPDGTVGTAVAAMEAADVDVLPIVDGSGGFVGVVTSAELLRLDEILGEPDQPR
ncbi:MAG: CBS domain-containing protein [Acidimicrobiales bacterium]